MPHHRATRPDFDDWLPLRRALWPDTPDAQHREEMAAMTAAPHQVAFLARDESGHAVGFAEVALRHDYVNGCLTSPVAFLEGIYVAPTHRRSGFARQLVEAAQAWAKAQGCSELASDADLTNTVSHQLHHALGFEETERVVYFRKAI